MENAINWTMEENGSAKTSSWGWIGNILPVVGGSFVWSVTKPGEHKPHKMGVEESYTDALNAATSILQAAQPSRVRVANGVQVVAVEAVCATCGEFLDDPDTGSTHLGVEPGGDISRLILCYACGTRNLVRIPQARKPRKPRTKAAEK